MSARRSRHPPSLLLRRPQEEAYAEGERAVRSELSERFRFFKDTGASLDMKVSGAMHPLSSEVVKACLPGGQVRWGLGVKAVWRWTGAAGSQCCFCSGGSGGGSPSGSK